MMKTALALSFASAVQASDPFWSAGSPDGVFTSSTTYYAPITTTPTAPNRNGDIGGPVINRGNTLPPPMPVFTSTEAPDEGSSFPVWGIILIVVGLAAIAAAVGAYLMYGEKKPKSKRAVPAAPPAPAPAPTPAPVMRTMAPAPQSYVQPQTFTQPVVQTQAMPMPIAMPAAAPQTVYSQPMPMAAPMPMYQQPMMQAAPVQQVAVNSGVCAQCGNVFMEDSNFCRKCGAHRPGH